MDPPDSASSESASTYAGPPPAQAGDISLGRVGATSFRVVTTSAPWNLGADALVLSVGRSGYGHLGNALRKEHPSLVMPNVQTLAAQVTPTQPLVTHVDGGNKDPQSAPTTDPTNALRTKLIVYATIREASSVSGSSEKPSVGTIRQASVAAVAAAAREGARSIVLPMLGTGVGGVDFALVAETVLPALRAYALDPASVELDEVVFVAPSLERSEAIEAAWRDPRRAVQLRMLADAPIDDDRFDVLGANAYASALAFVIDHPGTVTPLTIAINAPWGAGKTSLALLTAKQLGKNRLRFQPPIICWFNAWHHDDAPNIVSALASTVARAAAGERSIWRRMFDPLPSRMLTPRGRRKRHLITLTLSVVAAAIALLGAGAFHSLWTGKLTISVVFALATAAARELTTLGGTASDVGSLVRTPDAAFASGSLDEVRGDLGKLIHQATQRGKNRRPPRDHRRLIVFIDDLERCQPSRSIDVCETVSSLLSHEDVVVVLIGDMQTLATAAEAKYKDLAPRYRTGTLSGSAPDTPVGSFGELYLEKIVQFRFDIPAHDLPALKTLATRLLRASVEAGTQPHAENGADPDDLHSTAWLTRQLERSLTPFRRWRDSRRLAWEAREVRAALQAGRPPADTGETAGTRSRFAEETVDLYNLQLLLQRLDGSDLDKSYSGVAELVRPLPRDLKRLLNRIRFMLYLTNDRDLMEPTGPLSPPAVGKWALLAERWPDLASAVSTNPAILTGLETASATVQGFVSAMNDIVPGYSRSAELQRLLQTPPHLGPTAACLSRLTFRSARSDESEPARPTATTSSQIT